MTTTHHVLKALLHVAGKRDLRHYLNAINIRQESEGTLRLEATDGHVAMWARLHLLPPLLPVGETRLVERAALERALKLGPAELRVDAGALHYGPLALALVGSTAYPNLDRVVPAKHCDKPSAEIGLDAKLLGKMCKAIEALNQGNKLAGFILQPRGSEQAVLFEGSAQNGAVTFKAAMMPCRV